MRLSTGLVQALLGKIGMQQAFAGCVIDIYSATIPTTPDAAPNGSMLVSVNLASGAYTAEVPASGGVTLTGGSTSVTAVTVNGIDILGGTVNYNSSTGQTAIDVAAQINRNPKNTMFTASPSGSVITLTAVPGLGTLPNGWTVGSTGSVTATYANMASGVNSVNGLQWMPPSGTSINKPAADTWSGSGASTGTAGWFRIRAASDTGTAPSSTAIRLDGTIGTSGSDMNLPSLSVVASSPFSIPDGSITLPQS